MEHSTPVARSTDLRRLSIHNAARLSTPGRRSLMSPQVVFSDLHTEKPNEEEERNYRRNAVSMQRRASNIRSPNGSLTEISRKFNETEIKDHLNICTKLFTENKISAKNAWELRIIDFMQKITSTGSTNVLQIGGSSLDIGAKVYALRVDDIHTKGLKLASVVSRTDEKQTEQDADKSCQGTGETHNRRRNGVKKKKVRRNTENIIDKEGKTLFAPLTEVESVAFSTKENIEVSAIENLFTNKLHLNPSTHHFMLMSQEKHWVTKPDVLLLGTDEILDVQLPNIGDSTMGRAFKDFEIGEWCPNEEEKDYNLVNNSIMPDAVVLDENGVPIPELDGSLPNIFDDNQDAIEEPGSDIEEHGEFQAQIHDEIAHIVDAIPEKDLVRTDYGFNALLKTSSGKFFDKIWAGPYYWKIKYNRPSNGRFSGKTEQLAKRTKRTKLESPVDFSIIPNMKQLKEIVIKRKPGTVLFERITLPVPHISSETYLENLYGLLSKPSVKCMRQVPQEVLEVSAYNYENPNDSNYCSQGTDEVHDAEPIQNSFEEEAPPAALANFLGENLVEAPEMVSVSQVPYALHAKKMDMKKLKSAIWYLLTEGRENKTITRPTQFSRLYENLPSRLSKDTAKELSCPLAFVALLHLCNEKELYLEKNDNDFLIMKAVR